MPNTHWSSSVRMGNNDAENNSDYPSIERYWSRRLYIIYRKLGFDAARHAARGLVYARCRVRTDREKPKGVLGLCFCGHFTVFINCLMAKLFLNGLMDA